MTKEKRVSLSILSVLRNNLYGVSILVNSFFQEHIVHCKVYSQCNILHVSFLAVHWNIFGDTEINENSKCKGNKETVKNQMDEHNAGKSSKETPFVFKHWVEFKSNVI